MNVAFAPLPRTQAAAPSPPVAARLRGFTRRFGANLVIDRLDLDIAEGEFVALLGRSGSVAYVTSDPGTGDAGHPGQAGRLQQQAGDLAPDLMTAGQA